MHLGVEKHPIDNFKCSQYNAELLNLYYNNQGNMAELQTTFSFWCTTPNLFISTLWSSLYSLFAF